MRVIVTARHLAIVLSGILIGFTVSGVAYAISAAGFRYSAPKTGYLMLPAAAFVPFSDGTIYSNIGDELDTTGEQCFSAAVNLPNGAKMAQLAMWYSKSDAAPENLWLFRVSPSDSSTWTLATLTAVNTSGATKSAAANITDASLQTVNNARYAYFIGQCISDQEVFASARIKYTYTSAGD
jgi:hypothetical protein